MEQCTAVLCSSVTVSGMGQAREALRKRTLLPSQAAEQLGDVARDLHKQTGLVLCPDGHGIDQQGGLIQRLTFAETHWLDASGRFTPQAPLDKAREVIAALHRRPLPGLLEWHKGPMPFGSANRHLSQRVGNMSGSGGAMGQEVLAARTRQGLNCLSGMHRPLDPERMRRAGLRRTGDIVADRMLDVAAMEIEAGNAGANELGIIGDILKGIFDEGANGIQKAQASQGNGTNNQTPVWPTRFRNITSPFTTRPRRDVLGGRAHTAVDIRNPLNEPVFAVLDGTVKEVNFSTGAGNYIKIGHGNDMETSYSHTKPSVSVGQSVKGGDTIGHSDNSGASRAPHLHFVLRINGRRVDPIANLLNKAK